jgi:hypothetical protein
MNRYEFVDLIEEQPKTLMDYSIEVKQQSKNKIEKILI